MLQSLTDAKNYMLLFLSNFKFAPKILESGHYINMDSSSLQLENNWCFAISLTETFPLTETSLPIVKFLSIPTNDYPKIKTKL